MTDEEDAFNAIQNKQISACSHEFIRRNGKWICKLCPGQIMILLLPRNRPPAFFIDDESESEMTI